MRRLAPLPRPRSVQLRLVRDTHTVNNGASFFRALDSAPGSFPGAFFVGKKSRGAQKTRLDCDIKGRPTAVVFGLLVLGRFLWGLMVRFGLVGVVGRQVPDGLGRLQSSYVQVDEILKSPSLIAGTAFTIASSAHNLLGLSHLQQRGQNG